MNTKNLPASLEVSGELAKLIESVSMGAGTVYLQQEGRSTAVLLDIDHYNALLDAADTLENVQSKEETQAGLMADILNQYRGKSQSHQI